MWGNETNLEKFKNESHGIRDTLTAEIIASVSAQLSSSIKVVDIGCGVGDLLSQSLLVNNNIVPYGLDFSSKSIQIARTRFPHNGSFITHTIHKTLPYDSDSFDMVFCTDVLEHLEYPKLIISELIRISRPRGFVIIVVPDGRCDQFLGHLWFWSPSSLHDLLDYNPSISILPKSKELIAVINATKMIK